MQFRLAVALALGVAWAQAHSQMAYTVRADNEQSRLLVSMTIPVTADQTTIQLPSWAPGAYVLSIDGKNLKDLAAKDIKGNALGVTLVNSNTWTIASKGAKTVTVSYWINQIGLRDFGHWSGPSTYVYVVGRKDEKCSLTLELPAEWKHACGLDAGLLPNTYVAPDYDVLADNPVSVGKITVDTYTSHGVPHEIVYRRGDPPAELDRQKVLNFCKHISDSQMDFWGDRPFKKYVWHFAVFNAPDGGGGLEHLSSTQIQLATGTGPGTISVCSHEYFHAWNVKRLRSYVLGPFDYTELPMTGALWFLEGVTDYYADLLLFRYDYFDEAYFWRNIQSNTTTLRRNPARLEISPFFSSWRVRESANRRGNSNGYKISYYTLGWVAGLCLDIEVRARSKGRFSLDDVSRHLYEQCTRSGNGFYEGDIKNVLMKYGGPEMDAVYEKWIMQPGELPVEAQLAKMGLKWIAGDGNGPARIEPDPAATAHQKKLREGWYSGGRAKIPVGSSGK